MVLQFFLKNLVVTSIVSMVMSTQVVHTQYRSPKFRKNTCRSLRNYHELALLNVEDGSLAFYLGLYNLARNSASVAIFQEVPLSVLVPFALLCGFHGCHSRGVFQGVSPAVLGGGCLCVAWLASVGLQSVMTRLALVRELVLVAWGLSESYPWCPLSIGVLFFGWLRFAFFTFRFFRSHFFSSGSRGVGGLQGFWVPGVPLPSVAMVAYSLVALAGFGDCRNCRVFESLQVVGSWGYLAVRW